MNKTKLTLHDLIENENWSEAVIVFTEDSWERKYTETERSYRVSRDSYYFNIDKISSSLFGDCLDGKDDGVRLDRYMYDGWKVDYCYIIK